MVDLFTVMGMLRAAALPPRDSLALMKQIRSELDADSAAWRKSSYSGVFRRQLASVASATAAIMVRDTKERDGRRLEFTAGAWAAFTVSLKH